MKTLITFLFAAAIAGAVQAQELPTAKPLNPFAKGNAGGIAPSNSPSSPRKFTKPEEAFPAAVRACKISKAEHKVLAEGVEYMSAHLANLYGKVNDLYVIRIDLKVAKVRFAIHENAGTPVPFTTTRSAADKWGALAAVNGGFFTWKNKIPYYRHKVDGVVYKTESSGGSGIAFNNGGTDVFFGRITDEKLAAYDNVITGDWVLTGGKNGMGEPKPGGPAPRTMLAMAPERILYVMVVDGRQKGKSIGINYSEGAELMKMFGCTDGFFLDGGGSSTMVVRKRALSGSRHSGGTPTSKRGGETVLMNSPSDGNERKVLDHFLILDDLSAQKRPVK